MSERLATDNDAGTASQATDTGAKLYNVSGEAIQNTAKQTQACAFRRSQPPIPTQASHLFQSKPAGHSDGSQPGVAVGLKAGSFGSGGAGLVKPGGLCGAQLAQ
jgi:hypothetical protein